MRYKVKAVDDASYRELLEYLRDRVELFVASPRRRLFSTGELDDRVRAEVVARGGIVTEDRQFDSEGHPGE